MSVNLPEEMADFIDALVDGAGLAPSRCELVKMCLMNSLPKLKEMYEERIAIIAEIKTSENYLTPNDIIFVRDNRNGKAYTKYKVVREA
jgi:Arc/MetJ-type ribon-helix-helix transcriptional regulator